ncbi:hypothetical protein OG215_39255 (plasmid) [Streptomyces globisporus]|uniref:hypothetical protein n=1 Tax=Streptomyces globisporus TaxID=1908 RepID=UPI002F917F56|nr:hypothetical protein OG215_39255 [Streptomyces globisporus]
MPAPAVTSDALAAVFDPGPEAASLLNLLAWCGTAAGVAGLIVTGTLMALHLRQGIPGADFEHIRSLIVVLLACALVGSAGPIVTFLGPLGL